MKKCPGCGLEMPGSQAVYDQYYNASPECWSVYTEVLGAEFQNAPLFGQVHMMTVDTYAVQHAGGPHPDKSVFIHLAGLYLTQERGIAPTKVPPQLQRLATEMKVWPHFTPPELIGPLTVFDVATAGSPVAHARIVRDWAAQVWRAWSDHHAAIAALVSQYVELPAAASQRASSPPASSTST
ncbi:MAG TPA: DUF5946 family protein [Candidatus Polarisedimenticolia bacterium]|nr:DUF5946 family protein [Candidatus Polarisedimenticolia bacterium]